METFSLQFLQIFMALISQGLAFNIGYNRKLFTIPSSSISPLHTTVENRNQDEVRIKEEHEYENETQHLNGVRSKVYLRFSPLVEGPKILPIHVEVMILATKYDEYHEGESNDRYYQCLHRFDFLPANPSDETTITKLLSLQYVPGLIRHKILVNNDAMGESKCNFGENVALVPKERIERLIGISNQNVGDDSGLCISVKLIDDAEVQFTKRDGMYTDIPLDIPDKITSILETARDKQLHLIKNNCYSFSWDLLQSLE